MLAVCCRPAASTERGSPPVSPPPPPPPAVLEAKEDELTLALGRNVAEGCGVGRVDPDETLCSLGILWRNGRGGIDLV